MSQKAIDSELVQVIINYIAVGSISKGATWAELQALLEKLQGLESVGNGIAAPKVKNEIVKEAK